MLLVLLVGLKRAVLRLNTLLKMPHSTEGATLYHLSNATCFYMSFLCVLCLLLFLLFCKAPWNNLVLCFKTLYKWRGLHLTTAWELTKITKPIMESCFHPLCPVLMKHFSSFRCLLSPKCKTKHFRLYLRTVVRTFNNGSQYVCSFQPTVIFTFIKTWLCFHLLSVLYCLLSSCLFFIETWFLLCYLCKQNFPKGISEVGYYLSHLKCTEDFIKLQ